MPVHIGSQQWISYVILAAIIAFVLALRVQRMGQSRPLRVERLWVLPALCMLVATGLFAVRPPGAFGLALCAAGLAAGAALGWQRGRLMVIELEPNTQSLKQRASLGGVLLLAGIIGLRFGVRQMVEVGAMLHLNALLLADVLVAMLVGLLCAQRAEMYLRARCMLAKARQSVAGGVAV